MKLTLLFLCPALGLALTPFAHAQLVGGTVDPTTLAPYAAGNGAYYLVNGTQGPGVSALANFVNGAETETLIYGFKVNYNGPGPAPSTTTINIAGTAVATVSIGDMAQAEVQIGALANVGGNAGFAASPTPQTIVNEVTTTPGDFISNPFSQNLDLYVGQSYAVELYASADLLAATASAFVDPDITLGLNIPNADDYSITLTPGIIQGPFVPASAPDGASTAGLLALSLAGLFALSFKGRQLAGAGSL